MRRTNSFITMVSMFLAMVVSILVPRIAYGVTPGWSQCGTCEWNVVDDVLVIRPEDNGAEGTLANWGTNSPPWGGWNSLGQSATSARFDGIVHAQSCHNLFYNIDSLTTIDARNLDVSSVTDMQDAFGGCDNLKSVDISTWDVSKVTNCYDMFYVDRKLETIVFPEYADFRNCTSMSYMFDQCNSLRNVNMSAIHTSSKLTNLGQFFRSAGVADGVYDFSNMNTLGVTNFNQAFCDANYSTLNISNWSYGVGGNSAFYSSGDVGSKIIANNLKITGSGDHMFYDSDVSEIECNDADLTRAATLSYMFAENNNLEKLTFTSDGKSPSLYTLAYMFYNCNSLNDLTLQFDTSSTSTFTGMFQRCSALKNVDLSWMDMSNAHELNMMFEYCTSLQNLDLHGWDLAHPGVNISSFLYESSVENLDISGWKLSSPQGVSSFRASNYAKHIDAHDMVLAGNVSYLFASYSPGGAVETIDLTNVDTSEVTTFSYFFNYCTKLTSLGVSGFDTSKATDMGYMFCSCSGLTELDVSGFDTSKVTSMYNMFEGCSGLTELDLSVFDTSNVTSMYYMFHDCASLEELDLSSFDTSKVTSMSGMFYQMSSIRELDVTSFDVSSLQGVGYMFAECPALETIWARHNADWPVQSDVNVSSYANRNVFTGSEMLAGNGGTEWDSSHIDASYARTDGYGGQPGYFSTNAVRVVYDANGGVGVIPAQFLPKDEPTALRPNMFSLFDHTFTGWNTKADGTGEAYGDREVVTNTEDGSLTMTLYAQWVRTNHDVDVVDNMIEVDVQAGHRLTMDDLPAGTAYQIFEETDAGWMLVEQSNASGSVAPEVDTAALFTNKYHEHATSAQIVGTKTLDGFAPVGKDFGFLLRDADGNDIEYAHSSDGGAIMFSPLIFTEAGTYEYTVREVKDIDIVGTDGECYASFDEDGTFTIFRDKPGKYEPYEQTVIDGKKAVIFTDFEDIETVSSPYVWPWYSNQTSYENYLTGSRFVAPYNVSKVVVKDAFKPKCGRDMFYYFGSQVTDGISEVDLAKMDTSDITDMYYMFAYAKVTNLDLRTFNTSNVTNMSYMFLSCTALESLNVIGWDTSHVTSMSNFLYNCPLLKVIDLSTFDFSGLSGNNQQIFSSVGYDIIKFGDGMNRRIYSSSGSAYTCLESGETVNRYSYFPTGAGTWVKNGVDGSSYVSPEPLDKPYWDIMTFSTGSSDDITYDEHVERVVITVEDDGEFMTASVAYDSDGVAFHNKTNPGSLTLKKIVEGQTNANKDDEFTFLIQLRNENGQPLDEIYMHKR